MLLSENLKYKGLHVFWAKTREDAHRLNEAHAFDFIIAEAPDTLTGDFSFIMDIRSQNRHIPFIFLASHYNAEIANKAFELGADDFIAKPFTANELYMRLSAIAKRSNLHFDPVKLKIKIGKLEFDYNRRALSDGTKNTKLTTKEAEIVYALAVNQNKLLDKNEILKKVWGNTDSFASKSMQVYLTRIRKIFQADPAIQLLNVYGTGYKLVITEGEFEYVSIN
jgi:DNA-binding response OmpR family regulator